MSVSVSRPDRSHRELSGVSSAAVGARWVCTCMARDHSTAFLVQQCDWPGRQGAWQRHLKFKSRIEGRVAAAGAGSGGWGGEQAGLDKQ